jgi:twitching motility protein PilT
MFPPEEQEIARLRLSDALHAVVSQRLLPRADGHGRVAALEVMVCTDIARDMIKDAERTSELPDYIGDSREKYGMQTFDQHLFDLVSAGVVGYETAAAAASDRAGFERQTRSLRRRAPPPPAAPAAAAAKPAEPAEVKADDLSSLLPPS